MDDDETQNEGKRGPGETKSGDRPPRLVAEIALSKDRPAECTLFPADVTGFERTTTWITAEEGSFVGLVEMA